MCVLVAPPPVGRRPAHPSPNPMGGGSGRGALLSGITGFNKVCGRHLPIKKSETMKMLLLVSIDKRSMVI